MLSRLQVRNYVLIDSLEIDFPEGLIIITGQTGAGKSILLGALSLVMGARADAAAVAEGADNCVVEAEFDLDGKNVAVQELMQENDVEWDEGHLIIRRVVNRSGRSRAFVNDCPVSVSVLQELASHLIDIHSQHQTMMLSDRSFQLDTLDHFAGAAGLRAECSQLFRTIAGLKSELREVEDDIRRVAAEKDYNEAQFSQLDSARLRDGELAELEEEQKQLANAEEIKNNLSAAEELFTASSATDGMLSVDVLLKEAGKSLAKVGKYVPAASELSERVDSCRRELYDILAEISDMNSRTDMSQDRLEAVEDRMSMIYGLFQKHGCRTEAELIAKRDSLSDMLFDSTRLDERRDALCREIASLEKQLNEVAGKLHGVRVEAAGRFADSMTSSVRGLELPYAVFEVALEDVPISASGCDAVSFRFSASGHNAVDVAKCASGGELSRIMLALKAMRARYTDMPTMIFDEIDTGVSGSVADKMGSMICDMGAYMQVFAITHLPQVAAKGSAHYLVSKEIDSARAVSTIVRLSEQDRVMELARMLSGSVLTDAAIANAKALLDS